MFGVGTMAAAMLLGGGLGLLPGEVVDAGGDSPRQRVTPIEQPPVGSRFDDLLPAILAAATILFGYRRRTDGASDLVSPGDALRLDAPPQMRVVFIPGHGDSHASVACHEMVAMLGIDPDNVAYFDYRSVVPVDDHRWAARLAPVDLAARSLNDYLTELAADGQPIYVVGFSKGGATIAEMVSLWDRGLLIGPIDQVVGAALLDPPIASGMAGWFQSVGQVIADIPNDGGYDPVQCTVLRISCVDTRIDLGRASGVEIVVIQNPKAGVTNLGTARPEGLRVINAPDNGPGLLESLLRFSIAAPLRIAQAHRSVRRSPQVALCIHAEMWSPGSCGVAPPPARGGGAGRPPLWARLP